MPNPLIALIEKHAGPQIGARIKRSVVGLAQDFWHDGNDSPFPYLRLNVKRRDLSFDPLTLLRKGQMQWPQLPLNKKAGAVQTTQVAATSQAVAKNKKPEKKPWSALPGEISEKMWGDGFVTPGNSTISEALVVPLGLNKDMYILDLSAGLGGRMRKIVSDFGVSITGLEPDPQIAARGMELSIRAGKKKQAEIIHYTPETFNITKRHDCIIARETFYRVADKQAFFQALANACKTKAQIAYTDYIVNPEDREKPAILAWKTFEAGAQPLSLIETAEAWAKVGFTIRVNEDLTDMYRKEVMVGLQRLTKFLSTGIAMDASTKKQVLKRVETWVRRMAAMDQGMKFYRFYGSR